ncbi:hypothetical protein ACHHYP_10431 [Achlya hypogyna]|uniref:Transmembrane protein n=1 Tax=Achlya hypogyna TaxID=1202772 RepID=A0A1V9YLI0_ACHHY|nr:hypothetical protein ACHHYP_10431 [Achlya hypogyna]
MQPYVDANNVTIPWGSLCASPIATSVNWPVICAMDLAGNWPCCGLDHYNYLLSLFLWSIYASLTCLFCWYSDIFIDFKSTVEELHHIQTQALGVVIARQKQMVMGKQVTDPRRLLMMLAMWTELTGFSFIPYQLLYSAYSNGAYVAQLPASFQLGKFVFLTTFLAFYNGCPSLNPRHPVEQFRGQILAPFLFDACFMTYLYSILDVGGCANDMDRILWLGKCGNPRQYWGFFAAAIVVFITYYWGTLQYKLKLSEQVFAVRFRFQTSFNSLMTFTRTVCCMGFYTMQKLLLYFNRVDVMIGMSVMNATMFALLLRYNYAMQPCLGVGLFPNNLRTLSFATACYTSFVACLLGIVLKSQGRVTTNNSDLYVLLAFVGVYPLFALRVWKFNYDRAVHFQVPNLSLMESLEHATPRVRAIAAVCVTLEPHTNMKEVEAIVAQLEGNLQRDTPAEHFMVAAYSCQALWHLWFKYFHVPDSFFELEDTQFCTPFNLWRTVAAPRILARFHAKTDTLASRLWDSDRGWIPQSTKQLRARIEALRPQSQGRRLVHLVQRATDIGWVTKDQKVMASPLMQLCFEKAIRMCAALLRCNSTQARLLAARLLQEMYQCERARLSKGTMIAMMCILSSSPNETLAKSAVLTLLSLFQDRLHEMPADVVRIATTIHLVHLSEFVRRHHARNDGLVVRLLHFAIELLAAIAPLKIEPPNYLSAEYVDNLTRAQAESTLYSLHVLIDNHCDVIHATYAAYVKQLSLPEASRLRFQAKRAFLAASMMVMPMDASLKAESRMRRRGSSLRRRFSSGKQGTLLDHLRSQAPVTTEQFEAIMERKQIAATILQDVQFLLKVGGQKTPIRVVCRHRTSKRVFLALQKYPVYLDYLRDHITYLDYDFIRKLCLEMTRAQRWRFFSRLHESEQSSRNETSHVTDPQTWAEYSQRTNRPVVRTTGSSPDMNVKVTDLE